MIQTINISLIPSENKPVINVSQFDNISRVLRFNVFDDAGMEVPHVFDVGVTVLLNIRKNDNNIVVITGVIVSDTDPETQEVTGQYLTFELTEQACACVGSNFGEVSITDGDDEVIGSCNFKLIVERSPLAGGVSSQTAIDNLTTQVEEITEQVIGDNYYDKQAIDGMIDEVESEIPTKTSQLDNDSGFITDSDIPTIPTKTSQLTNDSGFITASALPTKTSDLENDSGFITASDIPTIPTKTSQLTNDSGFTTIDDSVKVSDKTWSSDKISDEIYAILPVGTASGSIASFNTALAKPLVSCVVDENATKLIQTSGDNITLCNYLRSIFGGTYGFIDLGTLNYIRASYQGVDYFTTTVPNIKPGVMLQKSNVLFSSRFIIIPTQGVTAIQFVNGTSFVWTNGTVYFRDDGYSDSASFKNSLNGVYAIFELDESVTPTITPEQFETLCTAFEINENIYNLPLTDMPVTYQGVNNFFTDYGDITVQYKDTIANYIDTRVNTVSNRSLSMMRTLETLEKSVTLDKTLELERGDNNDDNAR